MKYPLLPLAAAALVALSGCNGSEQAEEVTSTAPDPMASQLANASVAKLPPAVKANVTFRCKDNSLVYVDFFQGDQQASLRTSETGTPVSLTAENAGDALTGGGYSVKGTPSAITLSQPGKSEQSCKA